jgi:thymidylate synthase (FAD)
MKIVKQSYEIIFTHLSPQLLERAGRTCYKSEDKITETSADAFTKMLIERGHYAMVEFGGWAAVKFICPRGISHEIVRHRLFSFAQESTRYCNYSKDKFGNEITVIDPRPHTTQEDFEEWREDMLYFERGYFRRISNGVKPQIARGSLPIDLKTELNVAGNVREWRHFFSQRAHKAAHPQARELACPLLGDFRQLALPLFGDVGDPDCR